MRLRGHVVESGSAHEGRKLVGKTGPDRRHRRLFLDDELLQPARDRLSNAIVEVDASRIHLRRRERELFEPAMGSRTITPPILDAVVESPLNAPRESAKHRFGEPHALTLNETLSSRRKRSCPHVRQQHMRWTTLMIVAIVATSAAAETRVTVTGAEGNAEVCRFRAGDREKPIERWLSAQAVTCSASDTALTFPPGLWNVFARAKGAVSIDPILVDGAAARANIDIALIPAATLVLQLPPAATAVLYAPKHVVAFPAAERTTVPAGEELWLIVLAKGAPVAIIPIAALEPGIERAVDARSISDAPAVLGWMHVSEADRAAVKTARGVQLPRVAITTAGKEIVAASLPAPDLLNGAFVLFRGAAEGVTDLRLVGRGWLPFRRSFRILPQSVTLLREPIAARATATVMVNWSTFGDLAALDRSIGSCEPPKEAPHLEITISSCPEPAPGKTLDPASCTVVRRETPRDLNFGSVRVEEVPPGTYRAELR